MNPFLGVLLAVVLGFCILILPCVLGQYLVRRFGGSASRTQGLCCPRCGSLKLERLPGNRFTPFPGYECRDCGLGMRPPGTRTFYLVILAGCIGLFAMCVFLLEDSGETDLYFLCVAVAVAAYSVFQLSRPTPRLAKANCRNDHENDANRC